MKLKTLAITAFSLAITSLFAAPPQDDRARIGEFANLKLPIVLMESGKPTNMDIDAIVDVGGVRNLKISYSDSGAEGTIMIPMDSASLNFRFRQTEALNRMFAAYQVGRYNDVVELGRGIVYPAVPLMGISETQTNIHYLLGIFVDALVRTERFTEAKALMDSLQLSTATTTVGKAAIDYASAVIAAGRYEEAAAVLGRLNFGGANLENIPFLMMLVENLRKAGKVDEAARWYAKLQSTKDNPRGDEAALWMSYCDLQRENVISARIFLDRYADMKRENPIFSLRAMIMGMLLAKGGEVSDALDYFAQGIIYGDISSDWAAELRHNAGLAYKKLGDLRTSNEIFNEVILLYPQTPYKTLSEKELVDIPAEETEETEN